MKSMLKRVVPAFLAVVFCLQTPGIVVNGSATDAVTDPYDQQIVYHAENLSLPVDGQAGEYVAVDDTAMSEIKNLEQGTFLVDFTPTRVDGVQTLIGFSNGTLGYPNSYVHLYFKNDCIGFEIRQQQGGDYEKKSAPASIAVGTQHSTAMTADPEYGYRIFLDGECILECPISEISSSLGYGFISDINGIDSGYVGKTKRTYSGAVNEFGFTGEIHSVDVYNTALPRDYLIEKTAPVGSGLIYEASNLSFPDESTDVAIDSTLVAQKLASMNRGTFIVAFTPETNAAVQSLISFSNPSTANSHFHIYVNTTAAVSGKNPDRNLLGFEIRRQSGGDILKAKTPVEVTLGEQHIMAMTADPVEGYKLFFDGVCVYHMPVGFAGLTYGFLRDIPNISVGHIGGTERSNEKKYPYVGEIDSVQIYDYVLSDAELLSITAEAPVDAGIVQKTHLFNFGDWNSPGLRIPSIIRTENDVLIASADIRYGNSNDPPNNCDIGIRTSKDNGVTWSEPRVLLNFLDFPNEPSANQPCTMSASYCDSVLIKGDDNRVFLFFDAVKGNISAPSALASSGYKDINGEKRLALTSSNESASGFYLGDYAGETAPVFSDDGTVTDYTVGRHFELYENGEEVGNIFYLDSPMQVLPTMFSMVIYTDDDGETWSAPEILNPYVKDDTMRHCGTAPGIGIQIQQGEYAGRLLVPYYYNTNSTSQVIMNGCLVYSDDNGETWTRGGSPNDTRTGGAKNMGEIQVVEMPLGPGETVSQLKMFIRIAGRAEIATSFDGGETWYPDVEVASELIMSSTTGCQMSIIRYSEAIDGENAVIFCNPAATTRSCGAIRIGYITQTGSYDDGTPKYGFTWQYKRVIRDGDFGYSCLVELPNGNIGVLYEEQSKVNSVDHLTYAEFTLEYLKHMS